MYYFINKLWIYTIYIYIYIIIAHTNTARAICSLKWQPASVSSRFHHPSSIVGTYLYNIVYIAMYSMKPVFTHFILERLARSIRADECAIESNMNRS